MLLPTGFPVTSLSSLSSPQPGSSPTELSASHQGWILCCLLPPWTALPFCSPGTHPATNWCSFQTLFSEPLCWTSLLQQSLQGARWSKVLAAPQWALGVVMRGHVAGQLALSKQAFCAFCFRLGWAARATHRPCRPSAPHVGTASVWTAMHQVRNAALGGGATHPGRGGELHPSHLLSYPKGSYFVGLSRPLLQWTRSSGLGGLTHLPTLVHDPLLTSLGSLPLCAAGALGLKGIWWAGACKYRFPGS